MPGPEMPPEEIIVKPEEFQVDTETGRKYLYEKGGVRYGGDYLPEAPEVISVGDLPPPPEERIHPAL